MPGYKCRPKQLYLFTREEEEFDQTKEFSETIQEEHQKPDGEISMRALQET